MHTQSTEHPIWGITQSQSNRKDQNHLSNAVTLTLKKQTTHAEQVLCYFLQFTLTNSSVVAFTLSNLKHKQEHTRWLYHNQVHAIDHPGDLFPLASCFCCYAVHSVYVCEWESGTEVAHLNDTDTALHLFSPQSNFGRVPGSACIVWLRDADGVKNTNCADNPKVKPHCHCLLNMFPSKDRE